MENLTLDDNEYLLGLDDDDDDDNIVFLESNDGLILQFNKNYLKNIELVTTILDIDKTAGKKKDNSVKLTRINGEVLSLLKEYTDYHKENDYIVNMDKNVENLTSKLVLWDKAFLKKIQEEGLLLNLLECTNYLLFETFNSKLCYFYGQSETREDYKELFRRISLS
jgi:hypothetical protein